MKFNRIKQNIFKDVIQRKKKLKSELIVLLIKTIFQNQNISFLKKSYFIFLKNVKLKNYYTISKNQNVCTITGKNKTTFKLTTFNRQISKKYLDLGLLTNFKKN